MNDNSSTKTPEFRKVMRGYDPAEVLAYIDSLRKKLREARRREQELEEKLDSAVTRCAEVEKKSEELDAALADIDRERDKVLSDAQRRSAAMLDDTRKRCADAEREMRESISRQRDAFVSMHEMILSFRADLFEKYNAQIDSIDSIASLADAYDEAMMFCMQKNGVIPVTSDPSENKPASRFDPDDTPVDYTDADFSDTAPDTADDSGEDSAPADLEIPDHTPDLAASESFDYFTEEDESAEEENTSAGDDSSSDEEDFSPVGGKYVSEDYSFDEDNHPHPHRSDVDCILSEETPRVTKDDLPKDFDIYHASSDQLLELIYGKGSAAPADDDDATDDGDPLHGVDYSFGDDD